MDQNGCTGSSSLGSAGSDSDESRCFCGRPLDMVEVIVTPTTGGHFNLKVAASDSVDYLRKAISRRLKVPKERICLLYRDRHLRDGTLGENSIMDGSRITILPSVETGLLTQRPEQSVMQALESLNDSQVNDFLSGKAPLNLTMRLGDHMMLIQLQLSTVSPSSSNKKSSRTSSSSHVHEHHHPYLRHNSTSQHSANCPTVNPPSYGHYVPSHTCTSSIPPTSQTTSMNPNEGVSSSAPDHAQQSSSSHAYHRHHNHHYRVHHHPFPHNHTSYTNSSSSSSCPSSPSSSSSGSPANSPYSADADPPVRGCPHQDPDPDPAASLDTKALAEASRNLTQTLKQLSNEVLTTKPPDKEAIRASPVEKRKTPVPEKVSPPIATARPLGSAAGVTVNSCPGTSASSSSRSLKRQGAIIESMHHHGKGVYSGTFSGTLNPALQDRQGRPKRDISTIIHILNDLLCATPQYRRHSVTKLSTVSSSRSSLAKSGSSKHTSEHNQTRQSTNPPRRTEFDEPPDDNSDSSLDDSQVTRTKLEQLKYIMEQRRAMRKARRDARATPYSTPVNGGAAGSSQTHWSSEATTLVRSTQDPTDESTKDCDLKPAVVA